MSLRLPALIWVILLSTLLSLIGGEVFGYQLSGWGWFIPLGAALLMLPQNILRVRFPLLIWAPWTGLLIIHLILTEYTALQRTLQMLSPVVIGAMVSSLRIYEEELGDVFDALKYLAGFLIMVFVIKSGLLVTGILPAATGLAPEVMTNILLSTFFATTYSQGAAVDLRWWSVLAVNPVIALTRTAIAVNLLTLPLSFGPMKLSRRVVIFIVICLVGLGIFYTPRAQHKTFHQGRGEMSDVLNKDFNDSGRFAMWEVLERKIGERPLWGHGTGACEAFLLNVTKGHSRYPHNDWLLMRYDYGKFGVAVFSLTLIAAMLHAYRMGRRSSEKTRIFFLAGASSFLSFALMMYTDNITVYASFFGNLQFTLLGIAYAAAGPGKPGAGNRKRIRIRW